MRPSFARSLKRNLEMLDGLLYLDRNDDVVTREFSAVGQDCALLYVEGMSNGAQMAQNVMRPLLNAKASASGREAINTVMTTLLEATEAKTERSPDAAVQELMRGQCLLLIDTVDEVIIIDLRSYAKRSVEKPVTESVIVGPHEAFNETLRDNLTLLHKNLQTPDLICEVLSIGAKYSMQVALCYLNGVCPASTVDELKKRLRDSAVDYVLSAGILQQLVEDDPYAPLPQVVLTERPDRVTSFLLEGQAAILIDGSPRAVVMPMGFWHLFHAPDDTYMRWQYGTFMRVVRGLGALIALLLPAMFVTLVTYHPMAMPMTLLTSIMQSRSIVPISLFGEAVLMLVIFYLINESSTRVPNQMGQSLGLVSAIILGTAAVDAGLVSPLLIIIVAFSGLGGYALPNFSLGFAFRLGQIMLLVAGGLTGMTGLCIAFLVMLTRVAGMESLGHPYLAPASPKLARNPDMLTRAPIFRQRLRGYMSNPSEIRRTHGRMRRFGKGKKQ